MSARGHSDFVYAFILALLVHAAVGYCAGSVWLSNQAIFQPVFKAGLSSVTLTLLEPLPKELKIEPEKVVIEEPVEQPPLIELQDKEPEDVNDQDEVNADVLEKGVENVPVSSSQIRPHYPYGSRIRGEEGVVVLSAILDDTGRPTDVEIVNSSGYPSLDRAAIKAMTKAVFESENGAPVTGEEVEYTFRFQLKD